MSGDICIDNRFEIIDEAQRLLIEKTNITDAPDEMKVLYSILYRCWQMGWLDCLDGTIANMQTENAKLRELVRDMWRSCPVDERDCIACDFEKDGTCDLFDRMRELGVGE